MHATRTLPLNFDLGSLTALVIGIGAVSVLALIGF